MNTMEQLRAEIRDLELGRNNFMLENDRLQSDLQQVTEEAFHFIHSWEKLRKTIENLKLQSKYYYCEVQRIDNELCSKENERLDLIKHLKYLKEEASKIETNNLCLLENSKSCKKKLLEAEKEIMSLEAIMEGRKCDIKSLEENVQELSSLTTQLEEQLQCIQEEKCSQIQELSHCQQALEELLIQKEALCNQLSTNEYRKKKIERDFEEQETAIGILENELSEEQERSNYLENLLRQTKTEVLEVCLCNQRFQEEILGLNDKMEFLCAKVQGKQNENENYHKNIEILRKQIMLARHEKSYAMKKELRQTRRHTVAVTDLKDQLNTSRELRIISHSINREPMNRKEKNDSKYSMKNTRYKKADGEKSKKQSSSHSFVIESHRPQEKQNASNITNSKIKKADTRYSLFLENLTKMNSYAKNSKTSKNEKTRQCEQSSIKSKKRLDALNKKTLCKDYGHLRNKGGNSDIEGFATSNLVQQDTSFNCENLGTPIQYSKEHISSNNSLSRDIKHKLMKNLDVELNEAKEISNQDRENFSAQEIKKLKSDKFYKKSIEKNLLNEHITGTNATEKDNSNFSNINRDKYATVMSVHKVFTKNCDKYIKNGQQDSNFLGNKCFKEMSRYRDYKKTEQIEKIANEGHRKLQKKLKFWKRVENEKNKL